ncbi:MAG: acyltransferase [Xanthobacteraceae bacterium]|nr:acyltransferase [Xanthobacteraceae bacterium]
MSLPYRRDVDGLRAIAVLFVIGFHYFPAVFRGGFVGVDVFFVISGFLITGLIHQDVAAQRFSIAEFYGRRIRRIFPALICVLLVSLGLGFLFVLPDAYRTLGLNVAASAGFAANISLWLQQNYFAPNAEFNPLLHIWSLGVEEQFYLVWPLILLMFARRRAVVWIAIALAVLSFLYNVRQSAAEPVSAFFLPFSRFWELGAGAVLALMRARAAGLSRSSEWMSWSGLLLLVLAMVVIDRDRAFPGWWALLPVGSAVLLIAAGENARANRVVLGHPVLVYIGLISYPLYLWHWPLLVFARIIRFHKEPTVIMSLGLIGAACVLAHVTYRLIERPVRSGGYQSIKAVSLAALLAVCGGLGFAVYAKSGLPHRFPENMQNLVTEAKEVKPNVCQFNADVLPASECDGTGPAGAPLVFVWGDSHAYHLIPGLLDLQQRQQDFRLARLIAFACPPLVGTLVQQPAHCNKSNALARQKIKQLHPDTVILAARWSLYKGYRGYALVDDSELTRTIDWVKSAGVKHIVVFGQFPHWKLAPSAIPLRNLQFSFFDRSAARPDKLPVRDSAYLDPTAFSSEDMVKQVAAREGVTFISPAATLCDPEGCLIIVPGSDGAPVSRDDGHLTTAASKFFITRNADAIVPNYRK